MNRQNINLIGKWLVSILCLGLAAFFALRGDKDTAGAFGVGGGMMIFWGIIMDAF